MAKRSINSPIVVSVKRTSLNGRQGDVGAMVRASRSSRVLKNGEGVHARRRLIANFCLMLGESMLGESMLGEQTAGGKKSAVAGELLSQRERQTLELLLTGNAEKQIAAQLKISRHTVHVYVKSLYKRFDVNSRGELLARWVQQ
jgi:DNA-binding CsgD family transcriptional regulator